MVPENPWPEGKNAKAIGDDQTIWWEEKSGVKVVSSLLALLTWGYAYAADI
jgi:hypothetical protein